MFAPRARKFLIVAFLLLSGVTLYIRADIAPAGGAQSLGAAPVTITDSALSPKTVTIPVGGSVLWTNRGTGYHQVVADRGAFKTFRLPPAGSNRLSFAVTGIYPYAVDAKSKGTIIVIAAIGAAAASTPIGPTSSAEANKCGHPTIYHYDIRVDVHRYEETSWVDRTGTRVSISDWKASWPNAQLAVEWCAGRLGMVIPAGMVAPDSEHGLTTGQFNRKFDWNDTTPTVQSDPPCHFTMTNRVPAMASLLAEWYSGSNGGNFTFYALAVHNDPDPGREEMRVLVQQCNGGPGHRGLLGGWSQGEGTMGTSAALKRVNGVDFSITDRSLVLTIPDAKYKQMPFPLPALAAGKGFNFDTGMQHTHVTTKYGSDSINDRAVVSFSPMRP